MTTPLPSTNAPLVKFVTSKKETFFGYIVYPWNSYFQQFSAAPPKVNDVSVTGSPFSYTANGNGSVVVRSGTVSLINLIRGSVVIPIAPDTSVSRIIPISIGDTLEVTYSVTPIIQFLPNS